jgi:endonuclease/exonuclease/phosphatase (EEP) superfamily protein YafD
MKILHLNIERDKHLDKLVRLIERETPDVICLEEAIDIDIEKIAARFKYYFVHAPLVELHTGGFEGSVIMSKFIILDIRRQHYGDNKTVAPRININKAGINHGNRPKDGLMYLFTLLSIKIKDDTGQVWNVATTHCPAVEHTTPGLIDHTFDEMKDVQKVVQDGLYLERLTEMVRHLPTPLIFTADLNASRGEYAYNVLAHELVDIVPRKIDSTIDPKQHQPIDFKSVIDTIMVSNEIELKRIQVLEGVSNHKALLAELAQQNTPK